MFVIIRKVETFDGTVTILDGSTTDTNGGTDETVSGNFSKIKRLLCVLDGVELEAIIKVITSRVKLSVLMYTSTLSRLVG